MPEELAWLTPQLLQAFGAFSLVATMMVGAYYMFASGKIMTSGQVDKLLAAQERYNEKQDITIEKQATTIEGLLEANRELRKQNSELIEANQIINDFFSRVPVTGQIEVPSRGDRR